MSLQDLLDGVARTAPQADPLRSADEAWGTAGRRRRRARVTAGAAVLGLVVVAMVVGASIARQAPRPLPGNGELTLGQGIPAHIYSVKPWLPSIGSAPVPPVIYVVEQSYLDRPVAISVDGSYRYVPGPPDTRGYTLTSYAVSGDGEHLAVAWSGVGEAWSGQPVQAQIFVYDLLTGETRGPWFGAGLGGEITGLAWRPDNQGFAFQARRIAVSERGEATESILVVAQSWNPDGQDIAYSQDIVGAEGPVAWSPDGTELLVTRLAGPKPGIVSLPSGVSRPLDVPVGTVFAAGAWSPDGSRIAGLRARTYEVDLVVADAQPGAAAIAVAPLGEDIGQSVLGWREGNIVFADFGQPDLNVQAVDSLRGVPVGPMITTGLGKGSNERLNAATGVLATAPIVNLAPPEQSRLSWVYLQTRPVEVVLVGVLALALLIGFPAWFVTRRRRLQRDPGRSGP